MENVIVTVIALLIMGLLGVIIFNKFRCPMGGKHDLFSRTEYGKATYECRKCERLFKDYHQAKKES